MKKILIVPALAALVAVSACSKTETTNTTNEATVNETVVTEAAPVDANATTDLNAAEVATDNTLTAENATANTSNGL